MTGRSTRHTKGGLDDGVVICRDSTVADKAHGFETKDINKRKFESESELITADKI